MSETLSRRTSEPRTQFAAFVDPTIYQTFSELSSAMRITKRHLIEEAMRDLIEKYGDRLPAR